MHAAPNAPVPMPHGSCLSKAIELSKYAIASRKTIAVIFDSILFLVFSSSIQNIMLPVKRGCYSTTGLEETVPAI